MLLTMVAFHQKWYDISERQLVNCLNNKTGFNQSSYPSQGNCFFFNLFPSPIKSCAKPASNEVFFVAFCLLDKHIYYIYNTCIMIRTQVYLENQTHKDLLLLAQMEHKPMAEVTRDILREGIQKRKTV